MSFNEKCYSILKKVPKGKVTTYKEIAKALKTRAYQAVGNAMKNNPYSKVPCHRVVKSDGNIGGFKGKTLDKQSLSGHRNSKRISSESGNVVSEKINMLKKEGIEFKGKKIKNFEKFLYRF